MVDVVKTRTDLIERAATELGALTSMQELSDEDSQTIDNLIDPLIQQLSLDGVVDIGDTEAIEVQYFVPLAMLLANVTAPSFGQVFSDQIKAEQERILRRLTATRPTYEVQKAVYF